LGDVFLQSVLGEQKNRFIIETHSEHLLLRIMRRMRETATGNLPNDSLAVRPDDGKRLINPIFSVYTGYDMMVLVIKKGGSS